MANYKSVVEFRGKPYQVINRYGVNRLREKIIRLEIVPIGGRVPEDVVIVEEADVKIIEETYAH